MALALRQVPTDAAWDLLPEFTEDALLCGEDDGHRPGPPCSHRGVCHADRPVAVEKASRAPYACRTTRECGVSKPAIGFGTLAKSR